MALQKVIRVITGNSLLYELPQLQPRVCLMDNDLDNERYYFCALLSVRLGQQQQQVKR